MAKKKSKAAQERARDAEFVREKRGGVLTEETADNFPRRFTPEEIANQEAVAEGQGAWGIDANLPRFVRDGGLPMTMGRAPIEAPVRAPRMPRIPEPPTPATHPPRREVPSYKPTLGQAPPEPPPALPSGREAPKVSRTGGPNWNNAEWDARWKQQSAKTKAASTEAEGARQAMEKAIEAHRAARQPEVDMSPSATMERALKQGNKGGQGPGGGAGGGNMDMIQEAAPGDEAQGLTADYKSVLRDAASLNQAYQGNVTSPAIEENGRAIAEVGAKMAALPPTYKFSRDGIPEGMDTDAEMARLSALIGKNEASANDIDNYITLQVAQKTAEVRNAGKGKEAAPESASSDPAPNDVEGAKPQPPAAAQAPKASAGSVEGEGAAIRESGSRMVRGGGSGNRGANPPAAAPRTRGGGSSSQPKPPAESPVQSERPAASPANSGVTKPKNSDTGKADPRFNSSGQWIGGETPTLQDRDRKLTPTQVRQRDAQLNKDLRASGQLPKDGSQMAHYTDANDNPIEQRQAMQNLKGMAAINESLSLMGGAAGAKTGQRVPPGQVKMGGNPPKTPPVNNNISRVSKPPGLAVRDMMREQRQPPGYTPPGNQGYKAPTAAERAEVGAEAKANVARKKAANPSLTSKKKQRTVK